MIGIKWSELGIEKSSIMGLYFGKYIIATSSLGERFMLAFGFDRHMHKIIFINMNTNKDYVCYVDGNVEAEHIATQFAIGLETTPSEELLKKFNFIG
jgi:hypothetical protein